MSSFGPGSYYGPNYPLPATSHGHLQLCEKMCNATRFTSPFPPGMLIWQIIWICGVSSNWYLWYQTFIVAGNQKLKLMSVKPLKELEPFLCYFSLLMSFEEVRTKKELINNSLKIFIKMVLEKTKNLSIVFSLVLCSPFQAPFGFPGWWLMASLSPLWVELYNHCPEVFAGWAVIFLMGIHTLSVLGPAWVYFHVFPCPGCCILAAFSSGQVCGPLLGMTEVVTGLLFILKAVLYRVSHIDFSEAESTSSSKTSVPLLQRVRFILPRHLGLFFLGVMVCLTVPSKYELFTLELSE